MVGGRVGEHNAYKNNGVDWLLLFTHCRGEMTEGFQQAVLWKICKIEDLQQYKNIHN